ncbi:MAG: M67 family metallopeptidase [Ruminococcus sp.]|nr:M67 family metallopeptidase [Ruminococcus sp.]
MITLKREDYERILAHARSEAPVEACGLIGGVVNGENKEIRKVYILTNTDHAEEHFTLDPKEQLAAVKDMRSEGIVPLGNWHSHPVSPSRPSQEDIRLAYDSSASYLILSLMEEEPVLNSFHVEDGKAEKEELVII